VDDHQTGLVAVLHRADLVRSMLTPALSGLPADTFASFSER
jgi:hypothetical protein